MMSTNRDETLMGRTSTVALPAIKETRKERQIGERKGEGGAKRRQERKGRKGERNERMNGWRDG